MGSITIEEIPERTRGDDTYVQVVLPIKIEDTDIESFWHGLIPRQRTGRPWPELNEAIIDQLLSGQFDQTKFYIAREEA